MLEKDIITDFLRYGAEILNSKNYQLLNRFIQHGEITCYQHCIGVALLSLVIIRKLKIRCNEEEVVRGALLHDYFLYDWHEKDLWHTWHGFTHANTALSNAERDFELNSTEKEIIRKHMWPLNPALPLCREAWIVTMADKYCSTLETLGQIRMLSFLNNKLMRLN